MESRILEFLQGNLLYAGLAVTSGGMLAWQTISGAGTRHITPQQATLMINREDAVVIDVRDSKEWAAGHIPNARHIVLDQLEKQLPEIEKLKARPLILNCQMGGRSSTACGILKKHGFEKVFSLAGGIDAWREAGLPVTTK